MIGTNQKRDQVFWVGGQRLRGLMWSRSYPQPLWMDPPKAPVKKPLEKLESNTQAHRVLCQCCVFMRFPSTLKGYKKFPGPPESSKNTQGSNPPIHGAIIRQAAHIATARSKKARKTHGALICQAAHLVTDKRQEVRKIHGAVIRQATHMATGRHKTCHCSGN